MKKFIAFLLAPLTSLAYAENGTMITETRYVPPTILGIPQDQLIMIVVGVIVLYFIFRLVSLVRAKSKEKEDARKASVASAVDRVSSLKAERDRLRNMIEEAKKSYYKRELTEEQANKMLFEYKQKLMELEAELKRLGAS